MRLDVSEWKEFQINRLFSVEYGNSLELESCEETTKDDPDNVNFVARTRDNNGVTACVKRISGVEPSKAGIITVAGSGSSTLSAFVQEGDFYSGYHLFLLIPRDNYSKEVKQFICVCIELDKYKYWYGRQANKTLPFIKIKLPIRYTADDVPIKDVTCRYSDDGYVPDWKFMEDYIKALHHKPLTTKNKAGQAPKLSVTEWKRFYLGRLFDIRKGKRLTAEDQEDGDNLYIGAIDSNNGVANHIGQSPIHEGNTISLSYNGSVGEAFYQPEPYWATDDVNALYPKFCGFNQYIGLFMATTIRQEKYRFSYGRKWTLDNMRATDICLPVQYNADGSPMIDETYRYSDDGYIPDWQFMENYIKALPYGDRLEG